MTDKTAGVLNRLVSVCRDGEEFYGTAAEKVKDPNLQALFREMAQVRRDLEEELRPLVAKAGASPAEGGTIAGKTRQLFATLKATFSSNTEATLVAQLKEAEDAALEAFRNALDEPISDEARAVVQAKLAQVEQTHARMRALQKEVAGG